MDRKIAEEAARWLLTLQNPSVLERRDFVSWLRQSPEHLQEFLAISAISGAFSSCNWEEMKQIDELIHSLPKNVIQFPGGLSSAALSVPQAIEAEPSIAKPGYRRMAIAVGICAFAAAGALWFYQSMNSVYETSVGEQRTVLLDDGSLMSINAQSRAVFNMTDEGRYVRLEGEAVFNVAHDSSKPFVVKSGEVIVTAIGTEFNVHNYPSGVTVSVLQGTVGVASTFATSADVAAEDKAVFPESQSSGYSAILTAGKEAHLDRKGTVMTSEIADPNGVLSWQQRFLVFRGNTLEDMVAEFNRWNHRKIRLAGRIDSNDRYDGIFKASDPEALLDFLASHENLVLERSANEIVLSPRAIPR